MAEKMLAKVMAVAEGLWVWTVWPEGREGDRRSGIEATYDAARAAADAAMPKPPADPAWMVEVAREAAKALCVEEMGDAVEACQQALRLALERGHVVEAGSVPAAPSVDLEAALKRAWDAGWRDCRLALSSSNRSPDDRAEARSSDVSSILSTLPAKE